MCGIQMGRSTDGTPVAEIEVADLREPIADVLAEAFRGMWGHKHVDPSRPLPEDGSVVIALREDDQYVGLCRFWPDGRLVDQPGVVVGRRTPARKARLLAAACHDLGERPRRPRHLG